MLIKHERGIKSLCNIVLFFIVMSVSMLSIAMPANNIPEPLQPWVSWVLKDDLTIQCPITYNNNDKFCAYPNVLNVEMGETSGRFEQEWQVYAKSWISLPGDNTVWPKNVRINQALHPIVNRNNKPSVQLQKGSYKISGEFSWNQQPKSLSIPAETGLVKVTLNDKKVNLPDFRDGRLWLKTTSTTTHENNRLDLQVFRKITDTIPLRVTTQIKLDVSGRQREITLDGALLKDFSPSAINSQLPTQLDKNGRLKIQVRPGQWTVDVVAFNQQQLNSIALPEFGKPWPSSEIWVLNQQPQLRLIKVIDKNSIDPNQTQLPANWKSYQAFNMQGGEELAFDVIKRGNPEPEPDQVTLTKKIWLDFDGGGFTINDKLTGTLSRQWRLNAAHDVTLGQVTLNGKPQFITESADNKQGVEVRHGNLDLSADVRINSDLRTFSAGGWDMDFNQASATLYLPAGWRLMSLSGANADGTWINKWTLLDLFMVLITAIAIYKIWGLSWGAVGLVTMIFLWHEYDAPQYIWINLVIAIALLRVIPQGRFYKFIHSYRILTSVVLALIVLPFIVNQARTALYPQLEFSNNSAGNINYTQNLMPLASSVSTAQVPVKMLKRTMEQEDMVQPVMFDEVEMKGKLAMPGSSLSYSQRQKFQQITSIDPDAMVQTGPGLPSWELHQFNISWDGPVRGDQTISMILLSPAMHSLFNVLRIALVLLLAWRLLDITSLKMPKLPKGAAPTAVLSMFMVSGLLSLAPAPVMAEGAESAFPSQQLLEELREELIKPAECLPQCASIESMSIDLTAQQLTLSLRIHAQDNVLLPLPIPIKQWIPNKISIDDKQAVDVFRKNDSTLWLHTVKGSHLVKITGRVDTLNQLQFSFPLKPHYIDLKVSGWTAEGMDKEAHKISALTFLREVDQSKVDQNAATKTNEVEQKEIPVYAEVTRSLELGLDWYVTTYVQGVSGTAYPVILNIPLLSGESVVTDNIKVENNHAIVTLSNTNRTISWTSKLRDKNIIKLQASEQGTFIEKWSLNASPIWHIDYDGIPVIYHQRNGNQWQPEWQPWPGEKVTVNVSRPVGVKGNTVTIDGSRLTFTPGEQITAAQLVFNLRSSQGGQHIIKIPEDADLQTVTINSQSIPVRKSTEGIALPVSPGNQKIEIEWHEPRGITALYNSSTINLGSNSVNNGMTIKPGYNRWVLFTSGPTMGPAVLFWGVLGVIIILAFGLGRIKETPLSTLQWLLLAIGLSAAEPWAVIIIAGTILAFRARGLINTEAMSHFKFNGFQVMLIVLIFLSVTTLINAIQQGLLGSPDMQIIGNGSSAYQLNWFSDRITDITPEVTVISVPVYIYRLMMLAWSIWLAFALIKWAQWGWGNFTKQEYWRNVSLKHTSARKNNDGGDKGKDK